MVNTDNSTDTDATYEVVQVYKVSASTVPEYEIHPDVLQTLWEGESDYQKEQRKLKDMERLRNKTRAFKPFPVEIIRPGFKKRVHEWKN
jgi:hypothetical protein